MKPPSRMGIRTVGLTTLHTLAIGMMVGAPHQANADQLPDAVTARLQTGEVVIARAWHGKTLRAKADEYQQYLGGRSVNMPKIKGNLGYEFHRLDPPSADGEYVEFEVVSYWPSLQAVEAFAGADIQAVHDAPRDNEFLVDKETRVRNYRLLVRAIVPQQQTGN
jgi:heme-degrading monooxygenase HmoA